VGGASVHVSISTGVYYAEVWVVISIDSRHDWGKATQILFILFDGALVSVQGVWTRLSD